MGEMPAWTQPPLLDHIRVVSCCIRCHHRSGSGESEPGPCAVLEVRGNARHGVVGDGSTSYPTLAATSLGLDATGVGYFISQLRLDSERDQ